MGHQTEERQRVGVTEGRQRGAGVHVTSDGFLAVVAELALVDHDALAILGELAVHVHA